LLIPPGRGAGLFVLLLNLGHERFITTAYSYLPVSEQRQTELIAGLAAS